MIVANKSYREVRISCSRSQFDRSELSGILVLIRFLLRKSSNTYHLAPSAIDIHFVCLISRVLSRAVGISVAQVMSAMRVVLGIFMNYLVDYFLGHIVITSFPFPTRVKERLSCAFTP